MTYYVAVNGQTTGPFTIPQLKSLPVTPETLVWHQGAPGWIQAQQVEELASLFAPAVDEGATQLLDNDGATQLVDTPPVSTVSEAARNDWKAAGFKTENEEKTQFQAQSQTQSTAQSSVQNQADTFTGNRPAPACPPNRLTLSIISAVLFPLGIAAIVKSFMVTTRYNEGRYEDAEWLSNSAKKYAIVSIVIGGVFTLLYLILCACL